MGKKELKQIFVINELEEEVEKWEVRKLKKWTRKLEKKVETLKVWKGTI